MLTNYPVDRIDVNQNTNASLTCEFYGKPEPLVKWFKYHNGNPKEIGTIFNSNQFNQLNLTNFKF